MNVKTKESKFLDAITRYAEQEKTRIRGEVEEYKAQKIEQATDSGLKDAYELIQREIAAKKTELFIEKAQKENALRQKLFSERARISDEVFQKAEEKLISYTATQKYADMIAASARTISERIQGEAAAVYLKEADMALSAMIREILPTAQIIADPTIRIGGVKVSCPEKGILYDDTLDARLKDQRAWFAEHSGLKVV